MNSFAKRLEKIEMNRFRIPMFTVHLKDGSTLKKAPSDCILLLQYPMCDNISHFTAEGDLSGYGEFLGLFNALLDDSEVI